MRRICAVFGGTYMLNRPISEIIIEEDYVSIKTISEDGNVGIIKAKDLVISLNYLPTEFGDIERY